MDRREFVKAAVVTGSAVALSGCTHSHAAARAPSPVGLNAPLTSTRRSVWTAFEAGLDGDLVRPGESGFDRAKHLYNPRFDAVNPTAVVRAGSAEDVVETIRFAIRHDLAVRPRSGGHSYVGASTARGVIQLDLRRLKHVSYDAGTRNVTLGAGAQLFHLHDRLDPLGRSVPTGTCPTVGAAGLTLGGGVGVESRAFGLTCDHLQALTMVTADGVVRHVDADRDPDLFWASKGGGGGSFGVVTSMRLRTRVAHDMDFFFIRFKDQDAAAMLRGWQRRVAVMPHSSWANVHIDASSSGLSVRIVGLSLVGNGADEAQAMETAIGRTPTGVTLFRRSHHDGVRLLAGCSTIADDDCRLAPGGELQRESFVAGSDIVGRAMTTGEIDAVVGYMRQRAASGHAGTLIIDPLGGRTAAVGAADTAFRWRNASGIAQWYVPMPARPTRASVGAAYDWVRGGHTAFGGVSSGGYVNYLEPGRPLKAYYGHNLVRLRRVKATYDPDDFFHTGYSVRLP